jgi:hypothetical protein
VVEFDALHWDLNGPPLNLLPLLVRELNGILYSMSFEEGLSLGDGSGWKKIFLLNWARERGGESENMQNTET